MKSCENPRKAGAYLYAIGFRETVDKLNIVEIIAHANRTP